MGNTAKNFNCPSCANEMAFAGGESIFQTCESCHAPIIVPSDIFYPKDQQIMSGDFATLAQDLSVNVDQVTNVLTPGGDLPASDDLLERKAQIEKFEVYQEKIGVSSVAEKRALDQFVNPGDESASDSIRRSMVGDNKENIIEQIKRELRSGDKIEAINIYRDFFGKSLKETKEIIDAIEQEEFSAE